MIDEQRVKEAFARACNELWESQVRADLIYRKNLMLCEDCLGLFYLAEGKSEHPEAKCFSVSQAFAEKGITSPEHFSKALWAESVKLAGKHGKILFPRMTTQHEEPQQAQLSNKEMQASWAQARLSMLEQQVLLLQAERNKLQADKKSLEKEVGLLVERLLKEQATIQRIKLTADRHLDALQCLLHSEGCGCTGQCEQGIQEPA